MFDLLSLYEYYLVLVLIVNVGLRLNYYRNCVAFAREFPDRWPRMLEIIKEHGVSAIDLSILVPVALAFAMALIHSICNHFVWGYATLPISEVFGHPLCGILIVGLAGVMLYNDWLVLRRTSTLDRAETDPVLNQGELASHPTIDWASRTFTFGRFSTRRMVEERVEETLTEHAAEMAERMKGWMFRSAIRLAFGLTCWMVWAYYLKVPENLDGVP
ncbi:hypothetical protein Pan189_04410 [Stratiformator vulcanicus]|uniref:Uncharacterized protein n=2 Tax=Stratiformator vulcanicus TaxID=2527980 RepID=A0A517QWP4_9PLAN|nr:hypothetical protein Pan189_04410 [Stratiformator vulcanicus]